MFQYKFLICAVALVASLLGSFSYAQSKASFGLNDVTILLPLPAEDQIDLMLGSTSAGTTKGSLLSSDVPRFVPILTPLYDQEKLFEYNLKVIAIRFDPCFAEGKGPVACRQQIRLVWQPVLVNHTGVTTFDVALHSFYDLSKAEWSQFLNELALISDRNLSQPLQVNPTLVKEGYTGARWSKLKELVLKNAGTSNLARVTVMTNRMDRVWGFQGMDKTAKGWSQIRIPNLSVPTRPDAVIINQALFLEPESLLNLLEFKGGITLIENSNKSWFRMLSDSQKFKETYDQKDLEDLIARAYRIENPKMNNPGTMDCVSCHMAQTVRLWTDRNFADKKFADVFKSEIYSHSFNKTNTSVRPENTDRLRMLGYFGKDPIISDRTINETADILSTLN